MDTSHIIRKHETCRWIRADGNQCKITKLVPDSQYCQRHYWQALWMKTELAETPLPSKTDWSSLTVFAILGMMLLIGYFISPNWVLPIWINNLIFVLRNPSFVQSNPLFALDLLGWFAVGGNLFSHFWVLTLMSCYFPLRPKVRRTQLVLGLTLFGVFTLIGVSSLLISILITRQAEPAWFVAGITAVALFQRRVIVFIASDRLNPKIINDYGVNSFAVTSIVLMLTSLGYVLVMSESWILLVLRLGIAAWGFYSGVLLLSGNGRSIILKVLMEETTELADAMRPVDARLLGFTPTTPDARAKALERALNLLANLTPLEQDELETYLITKRRPTIYQIIIGLLAIILSAFFLEAPSQQLFIWFACEFLRLGAPLCP